MGWALVAVLVFVAADAVDAGTWREITGTIRRIDHQKKVIAIDVAREEPLVLQVDPATTILIDGQISALDELTRGSQARASFREGKSQCRAQWIEVQRERTEREPPSDPRAKSPLPRPANDQPRPAR
ncbi:MAG: hypothetical protein IJC63_07460 [Myxococcaceae bacterium]|nr:hypothetical protein [Myxococcaceae bacterium]MBR2978636.1 hypothetical protein [Myxococcaceae bacterium]